MEIGGGGGGGLKGISRGVGCLRKTPFQREGAEGLCVVVQWYSIILKNKIEFFFMYIVTSDSVDLHSVASNVDAALFLFRCKDLSNSEDECHLTQYKGKIDKLSLIRFQQGLTLPKYVSELSASFLSCKIN